MATCEAPIAGGVPGWTSSAQSSVVLTNPSVTAPAAASGPEASGSQRMGSKLLSWARKTAAPAGPQPTVESSSQSSASPRRPQQAGCPPHGCKAICGARPRMEDAYTAVPFLLEVPVSGGAQEDLIPPRIAPQVRSTSGCLPDSTTAASPRQAASLLCQLPYGGHHSAACLAKAQSVGPQAAHGEMSALHFFGVFDGHGGAEAALLCARTLHERLAEALHSGGAMQPQHQHQPSDELPQASGNSASSSCTAVSVRSASDVDPTAASAAASVASAPSASYNQAGAGDAMSAGTSEDMDCEDAAARQQLQQQPGHQPQQQQPQQQPHQAAADLPYSANAFEHAFTEAFSKVDEEFGKKQDKAQVGTTAVVALVGDRQLYIGNCGDSRAVLCRSGMAIPLTEDHKAARDDETARVEAAGGEVMWWNGERVMGVLAVSRSIGDHYLRPFVIAQPEVTILSRSTEDELLLLASDGLWDVLSNQEAASLAQRCLRRAQQRGASRQTAARVAASVLTRAAIDQGSSDNITVVVIDLSREKEVATVKPEGFGPAAAADDPSHSSGMAACHKTNPGDKAAAEGPAAAAAT